MLSLTDAESHPFSCKINYGRLRAGGLVVFVEPEHVHHDCRSFYWGA